MYHRQHLNKSLKQIKNHYQKQSLFELEKLQQLKKISSVPNEINNAFKNSFQQT